MNYDLKLVSVYNNVEEPEHLKNDYKALELKQVNILRGNQSR